jgi:predicted nucleic acid-binding Zn ribbon protein
MNRSCPECGEKIIGRSDKKFCSDACRNSYNNALNRDSKNIIRTINNRLRKNHRILEALNAKDKTKVTRNTLQKHGFLFDYFTGTYTTKTGSIYYYVYDQGYLPLENDFYLLVRKEVS